jgi:hypothetical protein
MHSTLHLHGLRLHLHSPHLHSLLLHSARGYGAVAPPVHSVSACFARVSACGMSICMLHVYLHVHARMHT